MDFLTAASHFSRLCPPGTPVEITLVNGSKVWAKTKGAALVWGSWALVEVEGRGCYHVECVRPLKLEEVGNVLPDNAPAADSNAAAESRSFDRPAA